MAPGRSRVVVVGGDAAGMAAASQALQQAGRQRPRGRDLEVVAFERGSATSYSACGIPYWVSGVVEGRDALVARTPEEHRRRGVDLRMGTEVVGVDLAARTVAWRSADGEGTDGFDQLVLATGAVPRRPDAPGFDAGPEAGVHGVQTLDDGSALIADLDGGDVRRVVVVGGGYIGLEVAEACAVRGLHVTVVQRGETPLGTVDDDTGAFIADAVRGEGVHLLTGEEVCGLELAPAAEGGRVRAVHTASGLELPCDLVVLGLGVEPSVALARQAGVPLGESGAIAVDVSQRTRAEGVWAAGDCTEVRHRVSGRGVHVPLGTHANKQGRVAGINLGGGYATFPGVVGTAITKVCRVEIGRTGLSSDEAAAAGFRVVTAAVDSTTTAGYMPGSEPVRVKLIADERSGRLLGGQVVGRAGAGKRVDALAICVWNEMTVEEVLSLDLAYAPPFAPVWDPVLIAARKAAQAVEAACQRG
ncbi:FAD-dependent oxidoreductase [Quadrisphaera oryzae]|uniref:FAD-dependent oxidoreductase n=1 Tax=Quadrisphaera TaxID=317661 RepID=UPI0016487B69|nr:FAD-dependent oxidoreductase [Quadrisphaera sp. RL12-1S]MBC3761497.1 FAD-dependent oxidoreductase [Quadrisphaera sp. RL12-1S]